MTRIPTVKAAVNYVDRDCLASLGEKPKFLSNGRPNFTMRAAEMEIRDARQFRAELSLDRQGFMLLDHQSAVIDFADIDARRRLYASEIECLIRNLTGATAVSVPPALMLLRTGPRSPKEPGRAITRPVHFAHTDFSANSGRKFARTLFFPDRELDPGRRIAGFNIWRAISPPPQNIPLAVCDVRTIAPADYVLMDLPNSPANIPDIPREPAEAPDTHFESTVLLHNPDHCWAYFSNMTRDEVLVFKSYDSFESHAPRAPHTAFHDSTCPGDTPPRMSIEARAFAYF
jgi:hypothetical protein